MLLIYHIDVPPSVWPGPAWAQRTPTRARGVRASRRDGDRVACSRWFPGYEAFCAACRASGSSRA